MKSDVPKSGRNVIKEVLLGGMVRLWARREEGFEEQPLCVSFGQFAKKEIELLLKMMSFQFKD